MKQADGSKEAPLEEAPSEEVPSEKLPSGLGPGLEFGLASLGILLFLAAVPYLRSILGAHVFTLAAAVQLYVPLAMIGKRGLSKHSLGFHVDALWLDLKLWIGFSLVTLVVYSAAYLGFHSLLASNSPGSLRVAFTLPPDFLEMVFIQIFGVALPEELFFRGYLQERAERWLSPQKRLFGAQVGLGLVLATAVFALAHVAGGFHAARLLPFFPGLLFAWLRNKSQSILSAVGYHAFCNLLAQVLHASLR